MAVGSLSKFSIPLDNTNQGLLMPKLKYRFRVTFTGFGDPSNSASNTVELSKQVVDIKRPSLNFNPITIDVYNSKIYLQGKPEWGETTINFRDDASGNVTKLVGQQIQKQFDFLEQSSAPTGADYKFSITYEVLDGGNGQNSPTVLETWHLYGCLISQVDYGDMAYNSSDPVQISCNIRFDNALQTPETEGVGTKIAPYPQNSGAN
jgi:hypothetical protein